MSKSWVQLVVVVDAGSSFGHDELFVIARRHATVLIAFVRRVFFCCAFLVRSCRFCALFRVSSLSSLLWFSLSRSLSLSFPCPPACPPARPRPRCVPLLRGAIKFSSCADCRFLAFFVAPFCKPILSSTAISLYKMKIVLAAVVAASLAMSSFSQVPEPDKEAECDAKDVGDACSYVDPSGTNQTGLCTLNTDANSPTYDKLLCNKQVKTGGDDGVDTDEGGVATAQPGDGGDGTASVDVTACSSSSQGDACEYDVSAADTTITISGMCEQDAKLNALVCTAQPADPVGGDSSDGGENAVQSSCDDMVRCVACMPWLRSAINQLEADSLIELMWIVVLVCFRRCCCRYLRIRLPLRNVERGRRLRDRLRRHHRDRRLRVQSGRRTVLHA